MMMDMMALNLDKVYSNVPVSTVTIKIDSDPTNIEKIDKSISNLNHTIEKNIESIKLAECNIEEYKKIISKTEENIAKIQSSLDKTSKIGKGNKETREKLKECKKKYQKNVFTYNQLIESRKLLIKELEETNNGLKELLIRLEVAKSTLQKSEANV